MEAQRWRLAMFASDGWYWEEPPAPETKQVLRCAARAAQLVDELTGARLERRLVEDLALVTRRLGAWTARRSTGKRSRRWAGARPDRREPTTSSGSAQTAARAPHPGPTARSQVSIA